MKYEEDKVRFLRVHFEQGGETNLLKMTHAVVIDRIIKTIAMNVETVNDKTTTAKGTHLVKAENRLHAKKEFNYASVLNIVFPVKSSARFMFSA